MNSELRELFIDRIIQYQKYAREHKRRIPGLSGNRKETLRKQADYKLIDLLGRSADALPCLKICPVYPYSAGCSVGCIKNYEKIPCSLMIKVLSDNYLFEQYLKQIGK